MNIQEKKCKDQHCYEKPETISEYFSKEVILILILTSFITLYRLLFSFIET